LIVSNAATMPRHFNFIYEVEGGIFLKVLYDMKVLVCNCLL